MYKASSATALLRIGHWSVMLEVSPDAILPRFQRRLNVYRASALPASKLSPCLQVGTTASPQAACMPVGRSIVPDSSEARGTSREAPSDVQQCRMGAGCGRRELFWAGLRLRAAGKVSRTLKLPLARCSFNAAWKELSGAMRATSGDQRVGAQRSRGAAGADAVHLVDCVCTRVNSEFNGGFLS